MHLLNVNHTLNQYRYSQVVNDTTLVIQIEPNNAKALYRRAAANNALGNHTYAVSDLDRVLGLDNNNPQVHFSSRASVARMR